MQALRQALRGQADAARASSMQDCMKSQLPFHGITAPLRRQLVKAAARKHPVTGAATLNATVLRQWAHSPNLWWRDCRMMLPPAAECAALVKHPG